ncbi:unnamed protein product [Spodoptera littoralis]|uniref:Serpin domain-containing protein n=1 Tax=Spodoptera littoralis TaxID=7109 RepID=A0A9P0IAV8_SPOLI|nr:unnamed protein product [Spodoptera littoralis]CAH1643508.1 unnamed protein product [Spodoptera littoralis]
MWNLTTLILTFLLVLETSNTSEQKMDSKALSSAIAQFSAKFCVELEKGKSVVSSPLSAEFVLALLTLGTSDPAHAELLTALGIPDDDSIRSSFTEVSSRLKSLKGVTFNVANKVYLKDGPYDLSPSLKVDAEKVFNAGIEKIDFNSAAAAVEVINKWVESQTNEKIKDLLSSDSVDGDTRLVLINALYFKGTWKKQFDPQNTMNQPFHITASSSVEVPMMYREDDYLYGESSELQAQLLEMPYVGEEASMLIVLPNEIEGLDGVLSKLASGFDLLSEIGKMYKTKVQVTIPKFKIETEINLAEVLPKLGIQSIFNRHNSGLTKVLNVDEPLFVSKAVQKAFIEVNEEGAEAAAATAMGVAMFSAMINLQPVPAFLADRPFIAAILIDRHIEFVAAYYANEE